MPDMMPQSPGMMPPGGPRVPPGSTSPATVPPQNEGVRSQARILMAIIGTLAKKAAGMFGPGTPEEVDALKIATTISKRFGAVDPNLTKQQVKLMGEQALPIPQSPSPDQMNAFQSAVKSKLPPAPTPAATPPQQGGA